MRKFILLLMSLAFIGCSTADVLVTPLVNGIIMWKDGEAQKYYPFQAKHVYLSTKHALKELDLKILQEKHEKNNTYKITTVKSNKKLAIEIKQIEENISRVDIRVDIMGDKPYAELVYKQIDINVNTIEFDSTGRVKAKAAPDTAPN